MVDGKEAVSFIPVAGKSRSTVVKLQWPLTVDGKEWTEIVVRRISTGELAAYLSSKDGTPPPNVEAPENVLNALDAEDGFAVEAAVSAFFPRRTIEPTEK